MFPIFLSFVRIFMNFFFGGGQHVLHLISQKPSYGHEKQRTGIPSIQPFIGYNYYRI